jgi:hypothetical protein
MPLVPAGEREQAALDPAHEEARKIKPSFSRGALVRVAVARNLAEAELIKGVLLEQGIPSLIRRTAGFDVPDFLAAGPRDVLVPETGVDPARALLEEIDESGTAGGDAGTSASPGGPHRPDRLPQPFGVRAGALLLALVLLFGALAGVLFLLVR